ncbi:MAG: peptidase [Gemmatimonadetes bacterium]|nr:peptidase [Gemmatimonadota bacterium]MXX71725.1 peptidase [Gemmatimonadota bacterium]MYC91191.1 peptidase [Gemmatimonadota bacterium]MYG35881.1 peptidase [Gemmatimonadota bacterium]MYJ18782.1 peptidase [Gemmatimonadota bacterium]
MIRSLRHRGLKRFHGRGDRRWLRPDLVARVSSVLSALDVANSPSDLDLPRYRTHPLKGEREGYWSIAVSGNWRIVFRFWNGDVYDVDLVDYH